MPETGFSSFSTTVDKTNRILKEIEDAYGWTKERRNQSYKALRGVLHALRDRLTVEESAQLAAQLPMLVRGLYFEGWDPTRVPQQMDQSAFLDRIRRDVPYGFRGSVADLVRVVLNAVRQYVTEGEWRDIKTSVPKSLSSVLP